MNWKRLVVVFCCGSVAVATVTRAAPAAALRVSTVDRKVLKYCDDVCELYGQDQAFSLLVEAFRQYRSFRIQNVYESRISAASALGGENGSLLIVSNSEGLRQLRGWVLRLAEEERELSLQKLQTQVEHMHVSYSCVRRVDEERIGQKVSSRVNTEQAGAELQNYLIVAVGRPIDGSFQTIEPLPATTLLLDAAPVIEDDPRPIARCEE